MASDRAPLTGIRVLDLTRVLAGPHCGRMLRDFGAEVIKIEPPDGDLTRFAPPRVNSLTTYFIQQNAGKKCVSIDLSTPEGSNIFRRLAAESDVVVENYRTGVMDRLGIGWEDLKKINPRLIYASITGYGITGPWRDRRAYASVIGAESGFTQMQAESRGGDFANDPWSHADTYTAINTASAVLAALYQRERTGHGDRIDISMAEVMLYVNEHVHDEIFDGEVDPSWLRSFKPGDYPILQVADGTRVVVSGHPADRGTFELMCDAMGRADVAADPDLADVPARLARLDYITGLLREWAMTIPDASTFESIFDGIGLAAGTVRSVRELAESDWARERGAIIEVSDRGSGTLRIPNSPWHFSEGTLTPPAEARYRGEDNRQVLRDVLGLSDHEIDALESARVLSSRIPTPRQAP